MAFWSWSKTAATNASADSTINWAEGQSPSSVNDSARAMMARTAEYRDDQSGSLTLGGTSTVYTLTTNQVFDTLAHLDKAELTVVPNVTSGAAPTLNVDGLGAKPIRFSTGVSVATGALIVGTPYRLTYFNTAGEFIVQCSSPVGTAQLVDASVTAAKLAAGAVTSAAVASSFVPFGAVMLNGTIVQSQGASAQTFAIKTLAAADPSASDPVLFMFRDVTAATGDYVVRSVTAALSIVIPSTKGIGFTNSTPGRVWIGALDNAGAVELFVINALNGTSIYPLQGWGIISSSAVSGATAAAVAYSTTARSSLAYVTLGYAAWEAGGTLGTAGTWNVAPTRMQLFQPGSVPLPGMVVQVQENYSSAQANGNTALPFDDTIPQSAEGSQFMTQAITPTSSANLLRIEAMLNLSIATVTAGAMALFQDSTANALATVGATLGTSNVMEGFPIEWSMLAATLSSTTFKIRVGSNGGNTYTFNGSASAREYGGTMASFMRAREIMA